MAKQIFNIKGRVIDHKTQRGIPGLRVEAWDKDLIFNDLVGSATTDEQGAFQITYDASYFKELFADRKPDLFFKVFYRDQLVHSTEDSILWNVRKGDTSIEIEVDDPTAGQEPTPKTFTVRGRIVQADGSPVEGITVKAFDKDVGGERLLGETTTDQAGTYRLQYRVKQLSHEDKAAVDLIVRAFDATGSEVATSPLILAAAAEQVVELVIGNEPFRGPSEYARLRGTVESLLCDKELAALTEEDITYLAAKTEFDPIHIAYLVKGARLEKKTGIASEAYYALFRQQLPTSLPALIAQDPAVQRRALETAIRNNLAGTSLKASLDDVMEQLREQIVEHAFRKPELPDRSSLSDLLSTTGLSEGQQRTFLHSYLQHDGEIEDFWQGLRDDPDFGGPEVVDGLQFTLQLGTLTLNYLPLVKVLQQRRQAGEFNTLRDLAKMERVDWEALIRQEVDGNVVGVPPTTPGEDDEEKITNYAQTMARIIEDAFPTAVIACRLRSDAADAGLCRFFESNPDFEFRTMSVDRYLSEHEDALAGIEDVEGVTRQLRVMQRLFNVGPRYEKYDTIRSLMADGVTSALAIRRMGEANKR